MVDQTKKIYLNPWIALITLLIVVLIRFWDPSFVESVRLRYFDQLITSQDKQSVPVHVVNIDEAALDRHGQFPFPRGTYADIVQELYKRDAGLVVFNILMPEKDRFNQDSQLATTMRQVPVVIPALAHTKSKNIDHGSPVQVVGQDPEGKLVEYPGLINAIHPLAELAAGVGIVNTFPEIDGVVRRMPLVIMSTNSTLVPLDQQQKNVYPALSLEALRVATNDRVQVKIGDTGVEAVRIRSVGKFETDNLARIWIDWKNKPQEHSLAQLPDSFNQGIVIVGTSAAGLVNPVATAAGEVWPHYLQASLLGTMLNGSTINRPAYADDLELLAIGIIGFLVIFFGIWKRK